MADEETLLKWTGPSSPTEQEKQERTERMVRAAVEEHSAFDDCSLSVFTKGSYANNTNVRTDSDVDVAVECTECVYWKEREKGLHEPTGSYTGVWTPAKLRAELAAALQAKFGSQVDSSGNVAISVNSSTARVDADIVPCFSYEYWVGRDSVWRGIKIFPQQGQAIVNFPEQHLQNGRDKNTSTGTRFKKTVRILKRVNNAMETDGSFDGVPSYLIECMTYNCPDTGFAQASWEATVRRILAHFWEYLEHDEPSEERERWAEVDGYFFLFHPRQKWSRQNAREFTLAAWKYLGFG